MNGIPVQVTETDREELPMALISEFPDETVYGDRYVSRILSRWKPCWRQPTSIVQGFSDTRHGADRPAPDIQNQ